MFEHCKVGRLPTSRQELDVNKKEKTTGSGCTEWNTGNVGVMQQWIILEFR